MDEDIVPKLEYFPAKKRDFLFALDRPEFSDYVLTVAIEHELQLAVTATTDDAGKEEEEVVKNKKRKAAEGREECELIQGRKRGSSEEGREREVAGKGSQGKDSAFLIHSKVHVSSVLLAEKSTFFHSLFTVGLKETNDKEILLHIEAGDEVPFEQLLRFMYSGEVEKTNKETVMRMLLLADKFGVESFPEQCVNILRELPVTDADACTYIDIPEPLRTGRAASLLPLLARKYLQEKYHNLEEWRKQESLMKLTPPAMEAVLANFGLTVKTEIDLFEMLLEYVRRLHPKPESLEKRQAVLSSLARWVRLSQMPAKELQRIYLCPEMQGDQGKALVQETLCFMVLSPKKQAAQMLKSVSHNPRPRWSDPQNCFICKQHLDSDCLKDILKDGIHGRAGTVKFKVGGVSWDLGLSQPSLFRKEVPHFYVWLYPPKHELGTVVDFLFMVKDFHHASGYKPLGRCVGKLAGIVDGHELAVPLADLHCNSMESILVESPYSCNGTITFYACVTIRSKKGRENVGADILEVLLPSL